MAELDIAAFLRARLDEAENGGKPDRHTAECGYTQIEFVSDECTCGVPAFVLADVAAKRQIVDMWARWADGFGTFGRAGEAMEATLRLLALPYVGHPEFREEWKP